ncbi:MAG: hypothetical protein MJY84_04715 [Bacteroidales bacterium]|nr:hypothetical protein [Bacteroidales bacterium]
MKSYISSAIVIALALACFSCSKETVEDNFVSMDQVLTLSKTISTEIMTKAGTAKPVSVNLKATYSIPEDEVLSFTITSDSEDVDVYYIDQELRTALENEFGDRYTNLGEIEAILSSGTTPASIDLGECIHGCNKNMEKGNGRGACKFQCWSDYIIEKVKDLFDSFKRPSNE